MSRKKVMFVGYALMAVFIGAPGGWGASKSAPRTALTTHGEKLDTQYANLLKVLQAEVSRSLPKVDEEKKSAFMKAYRDEAAATSAELNAMMAQDRSKDKTAAARTYSAAKEACALAKASALAPSQAILNDLKTFLADDNLDTRLVKCTVLTEAAPEGLAEFAQQGKEQEALVDRLLADNALMKQMLVAGGARDGQYGQAMQIYAEIEKVSARAKSGCLQRLALAVSLEHAAPIAQSNPEADTGAPAFVDPVKRYLAFEKAYLNGELDPAFKNLTTWDYRYVVNGDEPDAMLAWGRTMLRNYRPDEIATPDYRWRYVESVKTEVKYGSQDVKYDRPTLQKYQNMIMNGGVCGRRAFFGRFILRCFGIPTLPRPQPGHASLVHWTPDGWVIFLGAGWGWGRVENNSDLDFLAMTQARQVETTYLEVQRARWVGTVLGEKEAFGFHAPPTGFWNGVALYRQRQIVEESKASALAAVGTDIAEANQSRHKEVIQATPVAGADRKIVISPDGVITIPAVACSNPAHNTAKIRFMKSDLGGMQLHYSRLGAPEAFQYTFDAPVAGKYALTARVVTTSADQHLMVAANDAKQPTDIAVPFTIGMWDKTQPVDISLVKGRNVLHFSRTEPVKGLTIKNFTLTPVKPNH
jgi:hypothetical protein